MFWIPQMDDKIPGLEKSVIARRMLCGGVYVQDVEDTTVDHPCANTKEQLATNTRKHKTFSPHDPDRPPRPHSNLGPSKGEGENDRTEAQKQHSTESLFLGEAVHSAGEMASDGG
jgi:hypothetical protein